MPAKNEDERQRLSTNDNDRTVNDDNDVRRPNEKSTKERFIEARYGPAKLYFLIIIIMIII